MIEINEECAAELLGEAVAEKGRDHVYVGPESGVCHYAHGECPGCGVGDALHRAGVTMSALSRMDEDEISSAIDELHQRGTDEFGFRLTDGAATMLRTFQQHQDYGRPWGVSLDLALEKA